MYCKKCNSEKEPKDMVKKGKLKNGDQRYGTSCIDCNKDNAALKSANYKKKLTIEQKQKYKKAKRDWYIKNKDSIVIQRKLYWSKNVEISTLKRLKARAKREGINFNLTIEDIVIPKLCPILEIPIKVNGLKSSFDSISCDRIIPEKGYVKGNIKFISQLANQMKNEATQEQIVTFCKNIFIYLKDYDIVWPTVNDKSVELKDKEL